MAKLILGFLLFVSTLANAKSLQVELYAQSSLAPKLTLDSESVGGLSGMFWDGSKLTAVSDDRGKFGTPRFYELDMKITSGKVDFNVTKVQHLKDTPSDWILDDEAIVSLPGGDLVISTEGDNDKKPRAMPHIFVTSATGVYKSDIPLPDKFLPESTGLQKKGIENNRGFEGMTANPSGQTLYIMNEYPIIADQGDDDMNYWLRMVEFKKDKDNFKVSAEYPYMVTRMPNSPVGVEVFRGISEILYVSDGQFIVLERGARLTKTGIAYTGGLYLAETSGVKDVSSVKSLADGKSTAMKKTKLLDFEELFKNQKLENFEALAWGPALPDGRKSLLVMSDNNFSAKEKTTLLVFAVKEVE
ncbi:MAG: esterase-like activity of phytase family protein [Bdellovibrionales bacterium]|nr:esterase-like activity of phytase family protein [Bdellovibrionales bacterium]